MPTILIKNGTLIIDDEIIKTDLLIDGEKIAQIGQNLGYANTIIDASGRFIFPGGVDIHTHLDLPVMGTKSADDFETGTRAAVMGGTTCIVDFVTPEKEQSLLQALEQWKAKSVSSCIDYGFHMSVIQMTSQLFQEMDEMLEEGISSFKIYTAYPKTLMLEDGEIFQLMQWASQRHALIMAHCENGPVIERLVDDLQKQGNTRPYDHVLSRPPLLEAEATSRVLHLASLANCPIYIVHLTCQEALMAVRHMKGHNNAVFLETCPQYLFLSCEEMKEDDIQGAKLVCSPPLRPKDNHKVLWNALRTGEIQVVATDHCPFNYHGQKDQGLKNFTDIPNGLPGIETRLCLLYQGVQRGEISLPQFVNILSTNPAKLAGLYPQKGSLAPGSDADIVLFNPNGTFSLAAESLHMRVDYSPYEEITLTGAPEKVFVRGRLLVDQGSFLGERGFGQFLKRNPFVSLQR